MWKNGESVRMTSNKRKVIEMKISYLRTQGILLTAVFIIFLTAITMEIFNAFFVSEVMRFVSAGLLMLSFFLMINHYSKRIAAKRTDKTKSD